LEEQLNDLSARSITSDELVSTQRKLQEMEKKMDENENDIKEEMKRNMEQMEQKMDGKLEHMEQKILEALYGRLSKIDKGSEGTHENNDSVQVEQLSNNKTFPGGFNPNNGVTYGWSPKGVNLPKVELRKFDGTSLPE
jgi:DNA anti-recombination protein RmuC